MSQSEAELTPKHSRMFSYTSDVASILKLAQLEASERRQTVRPIHILLGAARLEKSVSGYVCAQVGITPKAVASWLEVKGETREFSPDDRVGFTPQTMQLLDAAMAIMKRWGFRVIDSSTVAGAIAESNNDEILAVFTSCGTTGTLIMQALLNRMREVGLQPKLS